MLTDNQFLISNNGDIPSRWAEAFDQLNLISSGDAIPESNIIWLKINEFEATNQQIDAFISLYPDRKYVVLTKLPTLDDALICLQHGACGYVNANAGPNILKQISQTVIEGGVWLGQDLMQVLIGLVQVNNTPQPEAVFQWRPLVSKREAEIIDYVNSGCSNKRIAIELDISERTVKAHLTSIFEKIGVKDRLQLALKTNNNH